ncbi:MAG: PepSY domain-containing protein [Gammaproteobacteria bacterium]|nr:PepSY domain-containing protein [Gammaproteobacteria bacterium]
MPRHCLLLILSGWLALLAGPGPAAAGDSHAEAKRLREAGTIMPLEQVLAKARKRATGRVLDTELEREHGRLIYEVEMLDDDGIVREYEFDAVTGALLEIEVDEND